MTRDGRARWVQLKVRNICKKNKEQRPASSCSSSNPTTAYTRRRAGTGAASCVALIALIQRRVWNLWMGLIFIPHLSYNENVKFNIFNLPQGFLRSIISIHCEFIFYSFHILNHESFEPQEFAIIENHWKKQGRIKRKQVWIWSNDKEELLETSSHHLYWQPNPIEINV